jgi:hypothetical protein
MAEFLIGPALTVGAILWKRKKRAANNREHGIEIDRLSEAVNRLAFIADERTDQRNHGIQSDSLGTLHHLCQPIDFKRYQRMILRLPKGKLKGFFAIEG